MLEGCSLCAKIPRRVFEDSPSTMPAFLKHLAPFNESGLRHCNQCGAEYLVSYREIYDDMSYEQEIEVIRKTSHLANPALLQHPQPYIRQDAAFELARQGQPQLGYTHWDPQVRISTLSALEEPVDLRILLDDADPAVRQLAGNLTVQALVDRRDTPAMLELLQNQYWDVRARALVALRHSQGLDPSLLAGAIENPSRPEELAGLEWLASVDYQRRSQFTKLVAFCQNSLPEMRGRAIVTLEYLWPFWKEQTPVILDCLLERLNSDPRTRYSVLHCLARLGPEIPLPDFLLPLASMLVSEGIAHYQEIGRLLLQRLHHGEKDSRLFTVLLPGLTLATDYQRRLAGECLALSLTSEVELGEAETEALLVALCRQPSKLAEDALTPVFARRLIELQNWPALQRLLEAGPNVAGHAALELSRHPFDRQALVNILRRLSAHPSPWLSQNCQKALGC